MFPLRLWRVSLSQIQEQLFCCSLGPSLSDRPDLRLALFAFGNLLGLRFFHIDQAPLQPLRHQINKGKKKKTFSVLFFPLFLFYQFSSEEACLFQNQL